MNWNLLVTKSARKNLASLPRNDQVRIERGLEALENNPFSGDIKRLKPSGWRKRTGNYRIFYDLDVQQHLIVVTAIQRRTSTTY
jgi:mRNA-degrading endonuclease RelE of RelBE toxin-antitoxin system